MALVDIIKRKCLGNHDTVFEAIDAGIQPDHIAKCIRAMLLAAPVYIGRELVKMLVRASSLAVQPGTYLSVPTMSVSITPADWAYVDPLGNVITQWDTLTELPMAVKPEEVLGRLMSTKAIDKVTLTVKLADGSEAARDFEVYGPIQDNVYVGRPDWYVFPAHVTESELYNMSWNGMVMEHMVGGNVGIRIVIGEIAIEPQVPQPGVGTSGNGILVMMWDDGYHHCGVYIRGLYIGKDAVGKRCDEPLTLYYVRTRAWSAWWVSGWSPPPH